MSWQLILLGMLAGIGLCIIIEVLWFWNRRKRRNVHHITITKGWTMLTKGKPAPFTVKAFNAEGDQVALPADVAATATNGTASAVDPVTGIGSVTPVDLSDETVTATAGGFTATVTDTVQADQTVASISVAFS